MNYEEAAGRYLTVKRDMEALDREYKERKAKIKEKMVVLENWFTAKAQEDGLSSIKTSAGTAYWSTHHSATVASREDFLTFAKIKTLGICLKPVRRRPLSRVI